MQLISKQQTGKRWSETFEICAVLCTHCCQFDTC